MGFKRNCRTGEKIMQRCVACKQETKNDWVAIENDWVGGIVCIDCAHSDYLPPEDDAPEDDGQPSWEQEWQDFGEVYDDEPNTM